MPERVGLGTAAENIAPRRWFERNKLAITNLRLVYQKAKRLSRIFYKNKRQLLPECGLCRKRRKCAGKKA